MNVNRAATKLKELKDRRQRSIQFIQHEDRQEQRLKMIAHLLHIQPEEVEVALPLCVEYLVSKGIINPKVVRSLNKMIK